MNRPDLLSSYEQQLVDAHRFAMKEAARQKVSAVQGDLRKELEAIYNELNQIYGSNWEEAVEDVRQRVYSLLY